MHHQSSNEPCEKGSDPEARRREDVDASQQQPEQQQVSLFNSLSQNSPSTNFFRMKNRT
jgi:hypothetical protein